MFNLRSWWIVVAISFGLVAVGACSNSSPGSAGNERDPLLAAGATTQPALRSALRPRAGAWLATDRGFSTSDSALPAARIAVSTGRRAAAAFEVAAGRSARFHVAVTRSGLADRAFEDRSGRLLATGVLPDTDLIVVADGSRYEETYVSWSAAAPSRFAWSLELGPGFARVRPDGAGGLVFADASGEGRLRLPAPYAIDARGDRRTLDLTWDVARSRATFDLDRTGLRYPIVVDPALETFIWEHVPSPPASFYGATLATPPGTAWPVLFGGQASLGGATQFFNTTWRWNGAAWDTLPIAGPTARAFATSTGWTSGKTLMFGGQSKTGTHLDQTWSFDGTAWTQHCQLSPCADQLPAARRSAALAYDPTRGRAVLFGGRAPDVVSVDGGPPSDADLADTWEFDGTLWTPILGSATTPPARSGAAMAYDSTRSRVVLFGGSSSTGALADTWLWDGTTWSEDSVTAPAGLVPVALVVQGAGDLALVAVASGAAQILDRSGGAWTARTTTSSPYVAVAAATSSSALLVGGSGTFTYDTSSDFTLAVAPPPSARYGAASTYSASTERVLAMGGFSGTLATAAGQVLQPYSDSLRWDGTSWQPGPSTPSAAYGAVAAQDPGGGVLLFGGWRALDFSLNNLVPCLFSTCDMENEWGTSSTAVYDGTSWLPLSPGNAPSPRGWSGAAFDEGRGRVVLFGGLTTREAIASTSQLDSISTFYGDTWEWEGTSWTQASSAGPSARAMPALAYDGNSAHIALFGGGTTPTLATQTVLFVDVDVISGVSSAQGDHWEWDGTSWMEQCTTEPCASSRPSARMGAAMVWDAPRKRLVLFGGTNAGFSVGGFDDTYEYDGSTWQLVATGAPPGRSLMASAFDGARRRIVVFGATPDSDTWEGYAHGNACATGAECDTGTCVDGVCCERVCGTCERCDGATPGVCELIADQLTDPDSCDPATSTCNGAGTCLRTQGAACTTDGECRNGHCSDGVCCDAACAGACDVCSAGLGAPSNGQCSVAAAGYVGSPNCGTHACDGVSSVCPGTCSSDGACAADFYCAASGNCAPRKTGGQACDDAGSADCLVAGCRVCTTAACADGYCCDSACNGPCDVCSAALGAAANGSCGLAPAGSAGEPACDPYRCDGKSAACNAQCSADSECASAAWCRTADATCQSDLTNGGSCDRDVQCNAGRCVEGVCCDPSCTGRCKAVTGECITSTCKDDLTVVDADGTESSCAPFLCKGGACQSQCSTSDDCAHGFVCSASACVRGSAAGESDGGCGCRAAGARDVPFAGVVLAGLVALAVSKRGRSAGQRLSGRRCPPNRCRSRGYSTCSVAATNADAGSSVAA